MKDIIEQLRDCGCRGFVAEGHSADGRFVGTLSQEAINQIASGFVSIEIPDEPVRSFNVIGLDGAIHHFESGRIYRDVQRYVALLIETHDLGKEVA